MSLPGVDVASYQGSPRDWQGAAGDIAFAAVKFTEVSGGGVYQDPYAAADWEWLKQNGKGRIAYLFAHPSASVTGTVAAFKGMCGTLGLDDGDGIMLDFEVNDGLPAAAVAQWGQDVLALMQRELGRPPLLYTYLSFAWEGNCAGLERWPLWISDPSSPPGKPRIPAPWKTWAIHQHSISGNIDRDVAVWPTLAEMKTAVGKPETYVRHVSDGTLTLRQAATAAGITFEEAARRSLANLNEKNAAAFRKYYDVPGGADHIMPRGLVYWL